MILQHQSCRGPVAYPDCGTARLLSYRTTLRREFQCTRPAPGPRKHVGAVRSQKTDLEPIKVDSKPMPRWDVMWQYLIDEKLPTLTPQQAKQRVDKGQWVLIDVRPTDNHEEAHPKGSKNVPLFKKVQWGQTTFMGFVRAAAMAVNGVTPMAVNEQFKDELARATGGKGAILMCEAGGTMTPSSNFVTGKVSRSLKAAYQAIEQGKMKNVAHLDGGVYNWYKTGLPMNGEYNTGNLGRTPNAANAPTGKYFDDK